MRILAISDVEEPWLDTRCRDGSLDDVSLVLSCGDLRAGYLTGIADAANRVVAYVPGNHDGSFAEDEVPGCVSLDGKIRDFHGLRILGLGGSLAYSNGVYGFTEQQMKRRVARAVLLAQATGGVDVVVAHVPPAGYGDLDTKAHRGFECFNMLLDRLHPAYFLHGHIHREYVRSMKAISHPSGTIICNCCGHRYLDISSKNLPKRKATRLFAVPKL